MSLRVSAQWCVAAAVAISAAVAPAVLTQAATDTPARCGTVEYRPYAAPRYSAGAAFEHVEATLYSDGRVPEKARFPYTWDYRDSERTDPWSSANAQKDVPIPVQPPPPGFDRTSLPPLIAFILAHTNRRGYVTIPQCTTKVDTAPSDQHEFALDYDLKANVAAGAHIVAVPWLRRTGRIPPLPSDVVEECASILNQGPQAVRSIRLVFTYADAGGHDVAAETLDATGPFAPFVPVGEPAHAAQPEASRPCRVFAEPRALSRTTRQRIAKITLSIEQVEYADGSSWRLPSRGK